MKRREGFVDLQKTQKDRNPKEDDGIDGLYSLVVGDFWEGSWNITLLQLLLAGTESGTIISWILAPSWKSLEEFSMIS